MGAADAQGGFHDKQAARISRRGHSAGADACRRPSGKRDGPAISVSKAQVVAADARKHLQSAERTPADTKCGRAQSALDPKGRWLQRSRARVKFPKARRMLAIPIDVEASPRSCGGNGGNSGDRILWLRFGACPYRKTGRGSGSGAGAGAGFFRATRWGAGALAGSARGWSAPRAWPLPYCRYQGFWWQ